VLDRDQLPIDSDLVPREGGTLEVENPATEDPFAALRTSSATPVERSIAAAAAALDQGPWPRLPVIALRRNRSE
jgi:acyl-CoA reductase-like NAD-dependent aldehyde dehydrogenase